jgi:hypothetical protein
MNTEQHYIMDSVGLVVARQAIPLSRIEYINAKIDGALAGRQVEKFTIMDLDPVFFELMEHPWILSACRRANGDSFRFDHAFGLQQPMSRPNLHGGPQGEQSAAFYHSGPNAAGAAWVGRMSVGICLTKQSDKTGGLAYIPGSHKSSYFMQGAKVLHDVLKNNMESECIHVPTLEPGDICAFPDCLVHGTTPWKASYTRRSLYYMYSPGFMAWRPYSEIAKYVPMAKNETQRRLLRPPFVASFEDSGRMLGGNQWRKPTL